MDSEKAGRNQVVIGKAKFEDIHLRRVASWTKQRYVLNAMSLWTPNLNGPTYEEAEQNAIKEWEKLQDQYSWLLEV